MPMRRNPAPFVIGGLLSLALAAAQAAEDVVPPLPPPRPDRAEPSVAEPSKDKPAASEAQAKSEETCPERLTRLGWVAPRVKQRFRYDYDFGDSWSHDIVVEAVTPPESGTLYPICLGGKRACPPEDCGGIWGYQHFLEALADRKHPNHAMMRDWWEGPFDAEAFDADLINRWLTEPDRRWRER